MKFNNVLLPISKWGRGPRGPCGLKLILLLCNSQKNAMSRPARALWIEMDQRIHLRVSSPRRGPRGPCGLKSPPWSGLPGGCRRGPRGPCGLKYTHVENQHPDSLSRPARALWIEIVLEDAKVYVGWGRGPRGPCGLKLSGRLIYILHGTVEAREGLVD